MNINDIYYGGHMSISRGVIDAIDRINNMKGNMIQIFISNPRSITTKHKFNDMNINNMIKQKLKDTNSMLVIHLPYTINIANPLSNTKPNIAVSVICEQLIVSNMIGSIGCVIHTGKHMILTKEGGLDNMYKSLKYIINFIIVNKLKTHIILETPAGQGSELIPTMNNSLEQFANFYNRFTKKDKKYLRICVDTCHIFAAGFNITTKKHVNNFFKDFNKLIGIQYIDLIHLNDSKMPYNSHIDRHANIGEGKIGLLGLKHFIINALYWKLPMILETPSNYDTQIALICKLKKKIKKFHK